MKQGTVAWSRTWVLARSDDGKRVIGARRRGLGVLDAVPLALRARRYESFSYFKKVDTQTDVRIYERSTASCCRNDVLDSWAVLYSVDDILAGVSHFFVV